MFVGIWVTSACNLKCKYCYEGDDKKELYMNYNIADQIISFIKTNHNCGELMEDPLFIQFHGGEPLLNFEVITYITEKIKEMFNKTSKQVFFGITTNAVLLNKEKIDFLVKNMSYDLSISIDGNQLVHDKMRVFPNGLGSYNFIIENVCKSLEAKKNIRGRLTFNSETVSYLFESVKHLLEIGFKIIVCIPDYFDIKWNEEGIETYAKQLILIKDYYKRNNLERLNIEIPIIENNIFKKTKCMGGYNSIHIDPVGNIYPCSYVVGNSKYKIGSIDLGDINEEYLGNISKINDYKIKDCEGCNNYDSCLTIRCRYLNELLTGKALFPSSTICAFENANYNFLKHS